MPEPMITIKKADGAFAKVPLSEFKKMQAGQKPPAAMSSKPATQPQAAPFTPHHAPAHTPSRPAVKHHPVHIKQPDFAKASPGKEKKEHHPAPHHAKPMPRADARSPLEEKLKIKTSAPLFSPKREKQVEEVLAKLGFSVMPEVLGRLKSLILAKLKDIKSEDETRELLARSIKNGGLGLTEQQVEKIIKSCLEVEGMGSGNEMSVPALKGNSFSATLHSLESELELPAPVSSPPFQGGARGGLPSSASASQTTATPSSLPLGKGEMTAAPDTRERTVAKMINESMAVEPVFKLDTRPAMKQSMQDVTASNLPPARPLNGPGQADVEMGPVEEIKSMTLTDFRRLSGNPEEAAKRFQQKMFNLQDESFVWYLDALAAYHNSPLYTEYMQAVCQSLAERKSLANVLSMKNGIKLNEVMALVEMERSL